MATKPFMVLVFVLTTFTTVKAMILQETTEESLIPEFTEPTWDFSFDPDFKKVSGADFIADALSNIGEVFTEMGGIIASFLTGLGETVLLIFQFTGFVLDLMFSTIPGAPPWVNIILLTPYTAAVGMIAIKLITRSGS